MNSDGGYYVWDPLVRLFHWSLVVLFVAAYLSGDEAGRVHIGAGYGIIGLLVFRLVWGMVGTQHARFSDFLFSPGQLSAYLKSLVTKNPERYTGHNPAGAYMIFALLIMLALVSYTGLKLYGLEGQGPLAGPGGTALISVAMADDDEGGQHDGDESRWEEIHEFTANLTVLLVLLHVLGVFVASRLHGENLVRAMITGKKLDVIDSTRHDR